MKKHSFRKVDFKVQAWTLGLALVFLMLVLSGSFGPLIFFVLLWWFLAIWQLVSGFINAIKYKSNTHVFYLIASFAYLVLLGLVWVNQNEKVVISWVLCSWIIAFAYLALTFRLSTQEPATEKEFDITDHLIIDA